MKKNYIILTSLIALSLLVNWCTAKAAVATENGKMTTPKTITTTSESVFKITCPDPTTIAPCTCSVRSFQLNSESQVECRGDLVTQDVINNVLTTLRRVNSGRGGSSEDLEDWLHISKFKIQHTKLTQLDLTPFLHTVFKSLSINFNENLVKIFGPNSKTLHLSGSLFSKKIKTDKLYMSSNNLTDDGLQDVLHYFDPALLTQLILSRNVITGSSSSAAGQQVESVSVAEFLPGLSRFINILKLDLSRNKIVRVGGGQFRRNQNLQEINLEANEIVELGENAFLLDSPAPKPLNENDKSRLLIGLTANALSDGRVHAKWVPSQNFAAFPYTSRPMRVDLSQNKFEFISSQNFQPFLTTNLENTLSFCDSVHCEPRTFFCSSKMAWLKNGRKDFEHRVSGLNCTNDRRHTVFTSEMTGVAPPEFFSLCPSDPSTIAPCICEPGHLKIDCPGPTVTQQTINKIIPELQKANSLPLQTTLTFHTFTIRRTNLLHLDLTPFLGHHFDNLAIIKNANLSKIYVDGSLWSRTKRMTTSSSSRGGSISKKQDDKWGVIDVNYVGLNENQLVDEGLQQLFNFFAPKTLTALNLQFNRIKGSSGVNQYIFGGLVFTADATIRTRTSLEEFLPGFAALSHLEFLVLSNNNISKIGGGQFKSNRNLRVLDLGYNAIEEIGPNGLLIDHESGIEDENLIINLRYNQLKDQNISQSNGLEHLRRPTVVDFSGNRFEFISAENFYPFLKQNVLNAMYFFFNQFVCDKRLIWLKEAKKELENRVIQVKCVNDPTQTAFTTSVIF